MGSQPSNMRIIGVAILLFSSVLLGVGIHHIVATGTCSSTGYSANYGPVPYCPAGTGWWFAFVFGGIIGCLIGAMMASSFALIFAGIFGAIGFGSLSILLDSGTKSGEKIFAAIFGGAFAIVGVIAWIAVIGSALGSLRGGSSSKASKWQAQPLVKANVGSSPAPPGFAPPTGDATKIRSAFGSPQAASAFGGSSPDPNDPIMGAYNAAQGASPAAPPPLAGQAPSPANLVPGLQAAQQALGRQSVDELAKLADLHAKGALTDAEFSAAKARLLGQA